MLERCCENEDTAQRAALSGCLVQPVLLTVAVELPHEIPYCPPNAMDVADPPAHFIYVWYSNSIEWFSGTQLRVHLDIQVIIHKRPLLLWLDQDRF